LEGRGSLREKVLRLVEESVKVKEGFFKSNIDAILEIAHLIARTLHRRNKILIFGNGGSAADAQHVAAEFVNRYLLERAPLPAIALTTDTSILTSIGNDVDFSSIFSRQIEAIGIKDDIALGITTSGRSSNVIEALRKAKEMEMVTIAFTGMDGGEVLKIADYGLNVHCASTPRIQETHITLCHILCELVEEELFSSGGGNG
jgi:D-sedoheptulose 7-phosphate isomerase